MSYGRSSILNKLGSRIPGPFRMNALLSYLIIFKTKRTRTTVAVVQVPRLLLLLVVVGILFIFVVGVIMREACATTKIR